MHGDGIPPPDSTAPPTGPQCTNGHPMTAEDHFCGICGAPEGAPGADESASQTSLCPNGHPMHGDEHFCGTCGLSRDASAAPAPAAPPANFRAAPADAAPPPPPPPAGAAPAGAPRPLPHQAAYPATASQASTTAAGKSRALKRGLMFGIPAGIAVLIAVVIIAVQASTPELVTVKVKLLVSGSSLSSYSSYVDRGDCSSGLLGYDDIHSGSQVTISGDLGQTLGTGSLSTSNGSGTLMCIYEADIPGVPDDQNFYAASFTRSQRGEIKSSKSELKGNDWTFSLSLGSDS